MSSSLSVRDLCERYGVSQHTVLAWIHGGQLRAINVGRQPGGKKPRWRITQQALEAFELARTPSPPPPRARPRKQPGEVVRFY
jgi:excisionase family DNA binding protein